MPAEIKFPNQHVSDHFTLYEFACKCGCGTVPDPHSRLFQELIRGLEKYRLILVNNRDPKGTKPVRIISGIRCHAHNASLARSASKSCHLPERYSAVDVTAQFRPSFVSALGCFRGLGVEKKGGLVSHLDVGHNRSVLAPARWYYS